MVEGAPAAKVTETFAGMTDVVREVERLAGGLDALDPAAAHLDADVQKIREAARRFARVARIERESVLARLEDGTLDAAELSRVRHDLRALVGAIKGYGELVLDELHELPPVSGPSHVAMEKLVEHASSLLPIIDALQLEVLKPPTRPRRRHSGEYMLPETGADPIYEERFHGRHVLVIDDSETNREILRRRLERAGLKVVTAASGTEGIETAASCQVDLILCDIMMPGMNGYEVLGVLKKDVRTLDIPVLVISAISEVRSTVRCIEAGAEDYLSTPFNPTILHARIKACLDKKLLRDLDRRHVREITQARRELETAIESMDDGFAVFDQDQTLRLCNRKFRELYPAVASLGGDGFTLEALLRESYRSGVYFVERRLGAKEQSVLARDTPPQDFEDWIKLRLSRYRKHESYMERLRDGRWIEIITRPSGSGRVSVHKDVTERKKEEERLAYLALHDPLTGLANRSHFESALGDAFDGAGDGGEAFALMYLDLDGFKLVNDTFGHELGDELLRRVAQKMRHAVRDDDLVARLGGDEFAIVLRSVTHEDGVRAIAARVLEVVGDRFTHEGETVPFGVSIGIARFPDDGCEHDSFLASADAAMYAAKKSGKGRYRLYAELQSTGTD